MERWMMKRRRSYDAGATAGAISRVRRGALHFAGWGTVLRFLLVWSLAACAPALRAQGGSFSEYDVKAVTLFKVIQFIKWPPTSGGEFTIGILGDDPFGGALDKVVAGEKVGGKRMAIKRARRVEQLKDCQVVFVPRSERASAGAVVASLAGTNVLIVGEHEGFVRQGAAVGFTSGGGTVGFEINQRAAQRAGLQVSSRLLKLATPVSGP